MLKIIEGLFDIAPNHDNETNAENLLSTLEEKGMLPPRRLQIYSKTFANTWEPEDETEESLEQWKDNYNKGYIDD